MFSSPFPTFRPEVQVYFRACERLLIGATIPNSPPFSHDEREMMEYYLNEVGKVLAVTTKE